MFILRTVTRNGDDTLEQNLALGDHYNIIRKGVADQEFERTTKDVFKDSIDASRVFAYLIYERGSEVRPMYINDEYYIMTDTGKTFSRERNWN